LRAVFQAAAERGDRERSKRSPGHGFGIAGGRVPRFSDVTEIDVVLIDRKDLPSEGAGETGIVGLAPAVSNAFFAATETL
jgi:hypothetical protein